MITNTSICSKILKREVLTKAINEAEGRAFYSKKTLSPSMDFMCARKTFFNLVYSGGNHMQVDPADITYENERAKVVGNNFHEYIQSTFEKAGVLRLNEIMLSDENLKIKGKLDSLIDVSGELFLIELKSAKGYSMHLMGQDGSPDIEHIKQIQLYFHLLEVNKDLPEVAAVLQGRPVNRGIILYESKNDHKLMEFLVSRDDELIGALLGYNEFVWKSFEQKHAPKFKFEPDAPECLYKCSKVYYEICHGKPKPIKEPLVNVWGASNVKETNKDPSFLTNVP